MPATTFDRSVTLGLSAFLRGADPPPPLVYITAVPEPGLGVWMLALVGAFAFRRK